MSNLSGKVFPPIFSLFSFSLMKSDKNEKFAGDVPSGPKAGISCIWDLFTIFSLFSVKLTQELEQEPEVVDFSGEPEEDFLP